MKIGKVSQTVLKRSILKQLHYRREESLIHPSVEEMCGGLKLPESEQPLFTSVNIYGNEKDLAVYAIARVINDLCTRGAKPMGIGLHIALPPYAYESRLKTMVEYAEAAGSTQGVQILYAKAEVNPVIGAAMVYVTGVGTLKEGTLLQTRMGEAGQDIVLMKPIGLEGTIRILNEKEEMLEKRFVKSFLKPIREQRDALFSSKEIVIAKELGAKAIHQAGDGGILAALWELTEASQIGMEVDIKKIPIRQETIEICECFHLNPYQLASAGCILIVIEDGDTLVERLSTMDVQAAVIGKTTKRKERILINGEERRYLDRPVPDELVKIYAEMKGEGDVQ